AIGEPVTDEKGKTVYLVGTVQDITERKRTEQALQKSEEQFRAIFDNALVGMYRTAPNGRILMANPALVKMLGFSSFDELSRRDLEKEGYGQQYPRSAFKKHLERQGKVVGLESAWLRSDGTMLYVCESAQAVRDESGDILYYEGTVENISDRKQAEQEKFKLLSAIETAKEAIHLDSPNAIIEYANDAMDELFGYDKGELIGKHVAILNVDSTSQETVSQVMNGLEEDGWWEGEVRNKRKDGTEFLSYARVSVHKDENGKILNFVSTQHDITEHRQAEEELIRYQTQLRSLVSQLALTEERERKEIEAVLHDDLLQRLVLCKMRVDELSKSRTLTDPATSLGEIGESICEMLKSARTLTFDLASPILYDIGLEAAIRDWLDREVNGKYDVVLEFEDDGRNRPLGNDLRVMLYRAIRELCTNIIKHSRAKRARVSIRSKDDDMEIIVEDDGIGMEAQDSGNDAVDFSDRGGLGLFGIRERLDHFGASMKIESGTGLGTRISIIVPPHCQRV
ncbi:MAG: PAS domain-containing sensor histidine kinase, partial [Planctomycetota bacterium]